MAFTKAILLLAAIIGATLADEWAYEGDHGWEHWPEMYSTCGGVRQSPIDIVTSTTKYLSTLGAFTFSGYGTTSKAGDYELINNGHTLQLNVLAGATDMNIVGGGLGGTYKLAQFHMHWGSDVGGGSEHTVNGKQYPMELHLVHYNTKYGDISTALNYADGLAVIGVFAEVGSTAHPSLDKLINAFTSVKYAGSTTPVSATFQMQDFLPWTRSEYYRYDGSLTTPKCLEIVTWTVMKNTMKVSQAQLDALRSVNHNAAGAPEDEPIHDNFRPAQPLNGRAITKSFKY
jgi:carbonic anhydrase